MKHLVWTENAADDLRHISDFIALDSEVYAKAVVDDVFFSLERIAEFPKSGRIVPEIGRENIREVFVASYRLIYEIKGASVIILTVIHGARKLK
jgi:plasmid stabilization system protein ParE